MLDEQITLLAFKEVDGEEVGAAGMPGAPVIGHWRSMVERSMRRNALSLIAPYGVRLAALLFLCPGGRGGYIKTTVLPAHGYLAPADYRKRFGTIRNALEPNAQRAQSSTPDIKKTESRGNPTPISRACLMSHGKSQIFNKCSGSHHGKQAA